MVEQREPRHACVVRDRRNAFSGRRDTLPEGKPLLVRRFVLCQLGNPRLSSKVGLRSSDFGLRRITVHGNEVAGASAQKVLFHTPPSTFTESHHFARVSNML